MPTTTRIVAQSYDSDTNTVIEETLLREDDVISPKELKDLGYSHGEQIALLEAAQEFRLKQQIGLYDKQDTCPSCGGDTRKQGKHVSKFHAIFTDHQIQIQRYSCLNGCRVPYTVEGIFGKAIHPDLLKKQAELGADKSYEKASRELNYNAVKVRPVNSASGVYKSVLKVGEILETMSTEAVPDSIDPVPELIAAIDGGHVKSVGKTRSFEAMIANVYTEDSIKKANKHHRMKAHEKTVVASAKQDEQATMKQLFINACTRQGMGSTTRVICLADGADNCWSVAESIKDKCSEITFVLDWFHVGMKFKNTSSSIPEEYKELYDKVKWHLWHGRPATSLIRLEQLRSKLQDQSAIDKLDKIKNYIENNTDKIVNYSAHKFKGLPYTSHTAESTVGHLINARQKNKQRMRWSRTGSHNVLQIRASLYSGSWDSDWKEIEKRIYKKCA